VLVDEEIVLAEIEIVELQRECPRINNNVDLWDSHASNSGHQSNILPRAGGALPYVTSNITHPKGNANFYDSRYIVVSLLNSGFAGCNGTENLSWTG
jgi:hypothetical protein